jgi:ABC-type bacteriocin/lantibiotic exporter with double-glycine peptidase domain
VAEAVAKIPVDLSALDADKKASYDKGYAQGLKLAERHHGEATEDLMKERDIAIQAAIQMTGRTDSAQVLMARGRKAGLKDGLASIRTKQEAEQQVATPVKALWHEKEQLVLDQIKHDLQLFKAQDPGGRGPKTHDEFMEKIIKAGGIRLPPLPEGQRYVYDPAKEELLIVQPGQ